MTASYQTIANLSVAPSDLLPDAVIPASFTLPPDVESYVPVEVLSGATGEMLADFEGTVIVTITLIGTEVTPSPLTFDIMVCQGCVLNECSPQNASFPCGSETTGQPDGLLCPTAAEAAIATVRRERGPCGPGTQGMIDPRVVDVVEESSDPRAGVLEARPATAEQIVGRAGEALPISPSRTCARGFRVKWMSE